MARSSQTVSYGGNHQELPTAPYDRARISRDTLMDGCYGPKRIESALYRAIRSARRDDKAVELWPTYIKEAETPQAFWEFIQQQSSRVEERRRYVWDSFVPLLSKLESLQVNERFARDQAERKRLEQEQNKLRAKRNAEETRRVQEKAEKERLEKEEAERALLARAREEWEREALERAARAAKVGSKATSGAESAGWTGRRTVAQQRLVVLSLVPQALAALETLTHEQELRLHNGPPEALNTDALEALRELNCALSELLALADNGQAMSKAKIRVHQLVSRAFGIVKETGELYVGGLPTIAASTVSAWGTFVLCQWVVGLGEAPSAAMSGAAVAATVIGAKKGESKPLGQSKRSAQKR